MKEFGGWQWPAHEQHMVEWLTKANDWDCGRLRYQGKKQRAVLEWCKPHRRRVMVDVGAHVGLWSWYFAHEFARVHAFEPVAEHRACFARNVTAHNVTLHSYALGNVRQHVTMHVTPTSSGGTWVDKAGVGDVPMTLLDDYDLIDVDLVKVDCEGGELSVLRGAHETLLRWRPVVIVEQKPGMAQKFGFGERDAVLYLQSLGAVLRASISGDFILSWDE